MKWFCHHSIHAAAVLICRCIKVKSLRRHAADLLTSYMCRSELTLCAAVPVWCLGTSPPSWSRGGSGWWPEWSSGCILEDGEEDALSLGLPFDLNTTVHRNQVTSHQGSCCFWRRRFCVSAAAPGGGKADNGELFQQSLLWTIRPWKTSRSYWARIQEVELDVGVQVAGLDPWWREVDIHNHPPFVSKALPPIVFGLRA